MLLRELMQGYDWWWRVANITLVTNRRLEIYDLEKLN